MLADGTSDAFYLRFTTPAQSSLILGTSRAAQAIQPKILHKILGKKNITNTFFNYSFTNANSPYGPVYYRSILKKLDPNTKNGIFILAVSPWSISSRASNPNDSVHFREANLFLDNTNYVNLNPNIFYLANSYTSLYYKILKNKITKPDIILHEDGWLEVNVPMDSKSFLDRLSRKVETYETENLPFFKYSNTRFNYLSKTITYLQKHGKVFIVRLPIHQKILDIENKSMPDFNSKIIGLSIKHNVAYLNLTTSGKDYKFTDGNHIYKTSGAIITAEIAEWISSDISKPYH